MTEQNVELDSPLKRLQRESHDNDERLKVLESLLQKPQPSFISDWQWNYLKLQHRIMRDYDTILSYRLEYWDKSPNDEDLLALEYQATMLGDRPPISEILARPLPTAAIDLGEQLTEKHHEADFSRHHVSSAATAIEVETPTLYDFPSAFRRLIGGERIARQGWNGKDMWLSVSNLEVNTVPAERFWSKHNRAHALQNGGSAEVPPCVTLKNAKGQVQMGWGPSQEDLFANDWVVLSNDSLPEVTAAPSAEMPTTYPSALHIQTRGVKGNWLPHDRPMDLVRELGLKCYGDRATLESISVTALLCQLTVDGELIGHAFVYLPTYFTLERSEHSRSIRLRAPVTILVTNPQYSFLGANNCYNVHSDSVTMTLEEGKLLSVQVDEMELVNKGTGDVNNEHILPKVQLYNLGYALQGQVKLSEGTLITVSPDVGTLAIEQK